MDVIDKIVNAEQTVINLEPKTKFNPCRNLLMFFYTYKNHVGKECFSFSLQSSRQEAFNDIKEYMLYIGMAAYAPNIIDKVQVTNTPEFYPGGAGG